MMTYTLSIIEGDPGPNAHGHDLFSPASPITLSDLGPAAMLWLTEHGYGPEHPDRRVLVTPAGEEPEVTNVIASYDVAL